MKLMEIWMILLVVILAAMVQASFHLSISVLTLLSGHTLSRKKSQLQLTKLSMSLVLGSICSTILIFSTFAHFGGIFYNFVFSKVVWAVLVGILVSAGVATWIFYYRRGKNIRNGTELWVPRPLAKYLNNRASKTKHSAEAFALGVISVLSELLFYFAPLVVSALFASRVSPAFQFAILVIYVLISNLPIFSIACIISGGHPISEIQVWRNKNKRFLQFASGLGMIVLAFIVGVVIFTPEILGVSL